MTGPRTAVVLNPVKVDDPEAFRFGVESALTDAGWPAPVWYETTPDDPGQGQADQAVREGARLVFACGGDGTVTAVAAALAGSDVALAVLPAGTGNLLAANLGLGTDARTAVQVALDGGRRRIDVGDADGRAFVVMAGMGFDAQMLESTSEDAKKAIGWLAYVGGAARHLLDRPMHARVRLDDGPPIPYRSRTVIVGNVGRLQGGVRLLVDAKPDDGLLNVAVLTPRSLAAWARLGWAVMRRRQRVPTMATFTAKRIEIVSTDPRPRQLDGDLIDPGPAMTITVRPKALLLCVPQPDGDPDLAYDVSAAAEAAHEG